MFQELTGLEYLEADIACKFDKTLEKKNWNDRIEFFRTNRELISTGKDASNPVGLLAALNAYKDTVEEGKPTGYMISIDSSNSGLQLLSVLIGCNKSFQLCGGNPDTCVDGYTEIYKAMDVGNKYTRKQVKAAIMTSFYGSVMEPEKLFKEDLPKYYKTIETMAPGAWQLNLAIQELWGVIPSNEYAWTMPDNFHCNIETKNKFKLGFTFMDEEYFIIKELNSKPDFHKGLGPNIIHSIDALINREMFRRCMFNKKTIIRVINNLDSKGTTGKSTEKVKELWSHYEESGFLSVRILDYLYEDTMGLVDSLVIAKLIQTLPNTPFDLVGIHDCWRCHANYGNDIRKQYNNILADINDSSMLKYVLQQITSNPKLKVKKVDSISRDSILNSNYLVC